MPISALHRAIAEAPVNENARIEDGLHIYHLPLEVTVHDREAFSLAEAGGAGEGEEGQPRQGNPRYAIADVGTKVDDTKPYKVVVLVGETGSGKTLLANSIVNALRTSARLDVAPGCPCVLQSRSARQLPRAPRAHERARVCACVQSG